MSKQRHTRMKEHPSSRDHQVGHMVGAGWIVCQHTCAWQPPIDIYEGRDSIVVRVEVAGMSGADFSATLQQDGRMLIIEGQRTDPAPKQVFHQMEIHFGNFRAEIMLPWRFQLEDVEATYMNGFLIVNLPRPPARRVPIVGDANCEENENNDHLTNV